MSNKYTPVVWGDILRIHGVSIQKTKSMIGLVISKGFTDSNIYYQLYDDFNQVNFYRQSLFQILPKSTFDMHDQLLQEQLEEQKVQGIKMRAEGQAAVFQDIIEQKLGKPLTYGTQVIFKHIQSQSYLKGMMKAAESGNGAFKVEVTEDLSSDIVFKIISPRSYENQKNVVYFEDGLIIYHPRSDCYMNFSRGENQSSYLDRVMELEQIPEEHEFKKFALERPIVKKPVNKRIPIIDESKSKCMWELKRHCSSQDYMEKKMIKSHDIVYIQHTKKNGFVSSTLSEPVINYLKETKDESLSYECFWELIPKDEDSPRFHAKNIITSRFLTFDDFTVEISPIDKDGLMEGGLINLICSEETEEGVKKLQRGKQFPIPENQPEIIRVYEERIERIQFTAVTLLPSDIFKIKKVTEETMLDVQYALSSLEPLVKFVQIISSKLLRCKEENFDYPSQFFQQLEEEPLGNIVLILQMLMGKIFQTSYDNIEKSGNTPNTNFQKILVESGITLLLTQILNLLFEPFKFIEAHKGPSQDKAKRDKIAKIFEETYSLIQKTAVNNESNRMYISRWVDLFLEHSNNINQPFIQECLVCILQNNPVSIEATIDQEKIKMLIRCFFDEAKSLSFEDELTTKYLRLFSTFIRCEDRVLKENQNIIMNQFFKNPENEFGFRFKADFKRIIPDDVETNDKIKSHQVKVSFNRSDFLQIPKFFDMYSTKWNYFLAYVNLLADICVDRNCQAIEYVSSVLQLQNVAIILFDGEILHLNTVIKNEIMKPQQRKFEIINIQQPFVRIAHNVYINNEKFRPIKRVKKISLWYKKTDGDTVEEINRTKRVFEGQKEEEEEQYLENILDYIREFLKSCDQNPSNLPMLYTILDLLKETIILGLWKKVQSFRELIPFLVLNITKIEKQFFFECENKDQIIEAVESNKKLLQRNRPEILMSIECKRKATQIFKYMNELELDIRLRYCMNFFKGIYLATENFNVYDFEIEQQVPQEEMDERTLDRNNTAKEEFVKNERKSIFEGLFRRITDSKEIIFKEEIWYNKLKEMTPFKFEESLVPMKNRYLFQGNPEKQEDKEKLFNDIVLSLFELPAYKNQKLLNSSLVMLREMFQQRKDLLKNFKSIIICGRGNLFEIFMTLKLMRSKFNMLDSSNILEYSDNFDKAFPYPIWRPYENYIKDVEQRSGIIQDLFFLSATLKDGTKLKNIEALMDVDEDIFRNEDVYVPLTEREKNNELFQNVNLAEGIYLPLISYIKRTSKFKERFLPPIHKKLLRSIYQYLTLLCFNNLEAKQCLMQYIPDILPHLRKNVWADSFIYEVCKNNQILINDEELVKQIIENALESCISSEIDLALEVMAAEFIHKDDDEIHSNEYERSRIFFCLRSLLLFKDEGHKRNQEILMNYLQANKYRSLIFNEPQMNQWIVKRNDFNLNPRQSFIASHFELFSALIESANLINIGKLQNLHPYTLCLNWCQGTNVWQIRRCLRSYINRLYYVNKDKDMFLFEEFIRKQFDIINKQLEDIKDLHKSGLWTNDLKIKNGIRFTYAQSQLMLMILQILISLQEILLKEDFRKILKKELRKEKNLDTKDKLLHNKIIQLVKNLGCLKKQYIGAKIIPSFINEVKELLSEIMISWNYRFLDDSLKNLLVSPKLEKEKSESEGNAKKLILKGEKSFFRNLINLIEEVREKESIDKLKKRLKMGADGDLSEEDNKREIINTFFNVQYELLKRVHPFKNEEITVSYDPHLQTAKSRIYNLLAKPEYDDDSQNIEFNKKLNLVKETLDESHVIDKYKDDQFIKLVQTFIKLDETSQTYYDPLWLQNDETPRPIFSLEEIITTTFQLIMKEPNKFNDSEKVFIIKLVRCYLTEAIESKQDYKLPVDKWEADYFTKIDDQEIEELFTERQKQIEKCGGSDFIMSIFSENLANRDQLLNEALLLGITYLFGGNTHCQDSLLNSMQKDQENKMLVQMKKLIKAITENLISLRMYKDFRRVRRYDYHIVDTYDYYSTDSNAIVREFSPTSRDKTELEKEYNNEKALCRIFRFLQLFCENNNIKMKHFLYEQKDGEEGEKKPNTINFIEEACLIMKKFFKVMNDKMVGIPSSVLNFIGEITQLPCLQNQKSLMKSTFFEDISFLAKFFNSQENKNQRKFPLQAENVDDDDNPTLKLISIYDQGIQLAQSNFEGNDPVIINEFLNKCKPIFLWILMRDSMWYLLKDPIYDDAPFIKRDGSYKENLEGTLEQLTGQNLKYIIEKEKAKGATIFEGRIVSIINVLTIMKKISDFVEERKAIAYADKDNINQEELQCLKKVDLFQKQLKEEGSSQYKYFSEFMQIFEGLILQIQVSCHNGNETKLQNVYFPKHPVFSNIEDPHDSFAYPKFYFMADETRDNIMFSVQRETQRDKLMDLLNFREEVYREIQSNYNLNYKNTLKIMNKEIPVPITSSLCEKTRDIARKLSYLICILLALLIFIDHDTREQSSIFAFRTFTHELLIRSLCFVQLFFTLLYCYLWGKMRYKLALQKYRLSKEQGAEQEEGGEEEQEPNLQEVGYINFASYKVMKVIKTIKSFINEKFFMKIKETKFYEKCLLPVTEFLEILQAIRTTQSGFYSLLIFVIASFLGNFYGVEWYTIHIFDFFVNIPMLTNVFKAILMNLEVLTILSLLATAFIFVFNILSLSTYTPVIYEDEVPDEACEEVIGCVLELYTSGAIGDSMDEFVLGRFIFDMVYFVFMELLFMNLVSGIMVDAFTELRGQDDARDTDKKGQCYICEMTKADMQKIGETFKKHTNRHLAWNYLFYIYCLNNKDKTDYAGIEYTIYNQIEREQVQWFPNVGQKDTGGQIQSVMETFENKIKELEEKSKSTMDMTSAMFDLPE